MWILVGGFLTLLSGFAWGREAAVLVGGASTLGFLVLGWEFTTSVPIDSPIFFSEERVKKFVKRNEREQLHRTLRFGAGVLVASALLLVAGY